MSDLYDKLFDTGFIDYGKIIPIEKIEKLIGQKMEDGWSFLSPYLHLREDIESHGYFVTSRGQHDGSIKILDLDEMAYKAKQNLDRYLKRIKKTREIMHNADYGSLNKEDQRKHLHVMNITIASESAMKNVLFNIHI